MPRRDWTRDELIVAFNLYCRTPFGRIHLRNPESHRLGRRAGAHRLRPLPGSWRTSPASIQPCRNDKFAAQVSRTPRARKKFGKSSIVDWDALAYESQRLLALLEGCPDLRAAGFLRTRFPKVRTRAALVKTRVNQGFFRAAVLAAYRSQCCVTGLVSASTLNGEPHRAVVGRHREPHEPAKWSLLECSAR